MIAIRSKYPRAYFIILTAFGGDAEIQRALEAGARAYVLKTMPPDELVDVIRHVHGGKKRIPSEIAAHSAEHYSDEQLTSREVDILRHLGWRKPKPRHCRKTLYSGRDGESISQYQLVHIKLHLGFSAN